MDLPGHRAATGASTPDLSEARSVHGSVGSSRARRTTSRKAIGSTCGGREATRALFRSHAPPRPWRTRKGLDKAFGQATTRSRPPTRPAAHREARIPAHCPARQRRRDRALLARPGPAEAPPDQGDVGLPGPPPQRLRHARRSGLIRGDRLVVEPSRERVKQSLSVSGKLPKPNPCPSNRSPPSPQHPSRPSTSSH